MKTGTKKTVKKASKKKPNIGSFEAIASMAGLCKDDKLDLEEIRKKSWK